jgi:DNA-binding NarL/FixJ family response regulator
MVKNGEGVRVPTVLLEDQPLMREVLEGWLSRQPDLDVVGSYPSGQSFRFGSRTWGSRVGLIIADLSLEDGDGLEIYGRFCRESTRTPRLVVFSGEATGEDVERARELATNGLSFISKRGSVSLDMLRQAVDAALSGMVMIDPAVAGAGGPSPVAHVLSSQELDVLALAAQGKTNQQIQASLHFSIKRIEAVFTSIYAKLGVEQVAPGHNHRVTAILMYLGIIPPPR